MSIDVSVVIPTYNRHAFLKEAIESCFAGNDDIEIEVIVVDDGSDDGTRDYLVSLEEDRRVRPFLQEHGGAQVARNRGLGEAKGWAIKFLDDDDYLVPGRLVEEYALLRASDAAVCYGQVDKYFEVEGVKRGRTANAEHEYLLGGLMSGEVSRWPLAFTFERSALRGMHWDESLNHQQDWAFALEAAGRGMRCVRLDASVAVHRIHRENRISDNRAGDPPAFRINRMADMFWRAWQGFVESEAPEHKVRRAAAVGLWRLAHKVAPFDFSGFRRGYQRVQRVDPTFRPPRPHAILRLADRLLSPVATEWLMNPVRKAKVRL